MKLLIMQFYPSYYYLIPLRSKYSLQHSVLCLCCSVNMRDQISHTYKTTGKVRSHVEDKMSELYGSKYSQNLIYSCFFHESNLLVFPIV
jgi:hypothetical protein